ncbi:MAG: alpha/beta hydrolase [Polyangiaceae bacterium]|nr:alpha/beta hydrolase [Polyangiaceae bacterium]
MLPRLPFAVDTRYVTSFDGTKIAYHVTREPFPGAPVILLANGLGGPPASWRAQVDYLSDRYRLLTWDYRGLYSSEKPKSGESAAYAIPNHVRDLEIIAKTEGITSAALIGWSMGVQVSLEAYRRLPQMIKLLVLINGTSGRALDTVTPIPGMKAVMPSLVELARKAHSLAKQLAQKTTSQPETVVWFKRMGLVGETFDDGVFAELVHQYGGLDMDAFFQNLKAIGTHDANDVLPLINVPVLVITGDRDAFTPRALAQQMARNIRNADMLVVRGGTHYTCVEFPELVNLRIERFFRENGFLPARPTSSARP